MQGRTKYPEQHDKAKFKWSSINNNNISLINAYKDKDGTNICMIEAKLPMPSLNSPPKFESFSTLPDKRKEIYYKAI